MSVLNSTLGLNGQLGVKVIRAKDKIQKAPLSWRIKNTLRYLLAFEWMVPILAFIATIIPGVTIFTSKLFVKVKKQDGTIVDYGMVGRHVITTVGKGFIVDAWQNLVELENMKYHGTGTGTNAAAVGDTALQTELTTEYATNNTRPTGTTAEASATVFSSVATNTVDATVAATEWGIFSQAATGGGVLFDRQVFSVVNLASGDSLQTTYELTVS